MCHKKKQMDGEENILLQDISRKEDVSEQDMASDLLFRVMG